MPADELRKALRKLGADQREARDVVERYAAPSRERVALSHEHDPTLPREWLDVEALVRFHLADLGDRDVDIAVQETACHCRPVTDRDIDSRAGTLAAEQAGSASDRDVGRVGSGANADLSRLSGDDMTQLPLGFDGFVDDRPGEVDIHLDGPDEIHYWTCKYVDGELTDLWVDNN